MAKKKVGDLIKEARTNAGLSQEKLAAGISGLSASDISKAERNEKVLTQAQLKEIAKLTGVTQKSLLDAAAGTSSTKTSGKTTGTMVKKTGTAASKKTGSSAAKKTSSATAKKTGSASGTSIKVSATEKRLVELYRAADSDTKKAALALLKGEKTQTGGVLEAILGNTSIMDTISGFFTKE